MDFESVLRCKSPLGLTGAETLLGAGCPSPVFQSPPLATSFPEDIHALSNIGEERSLIFGFAVKRAENTQDLADDVLCNDGLQGCRDRSQHKESVGPCFPSTARSALPLAFSRSRAARTRTSDRARSATTKWKRLAMSWPVLTSSACCQGSRLRLRVGPKPLGRPKLGCLYSCCSPALSWFIYHLRRL